MSDSPPAPASAGALLRAAREKQGLHIAALAAAIKVTPRKLDALENDRWNELPDAAFTRALAQTVCRSLKIDAKPVLDLLPPADPITLEPGPNAINEPFSERSGRDDGGWMGAAIRPMVIAAVALMLAAVVVYFVPEAWWTGGESTAPVVPVASAPVTAVPAPAVPAPDTPASASEVSAVAPAAVIATSPSAAASGPGSDKAPAGSAEPSLSTGPLTGPLQVRTTDASWIEVRDARGRVLLSRIVQPGERVGLDGEAPFRLVVGNAGVTEVVFRGRAVDLGTQARDSVARLELK